MLPLLYSNRHLSKIAVSACLIGKKCRYDGGCSNNVEELKSCVAVCPEVLGGLGIPRVPCEINKGSGEDVLAGRARVIGKDGKDYTEEFLEGAKKALKICLENNITAVILKERSPSCGVEAIYNEGRIIKGCGVTTALLTKYGIKVISDTEVLNE